MGKTILTPKQQLLLTLLSKENIIKHFYLSGGTALAQYYLHHRYSEDLDFFSQEETDMLSIQILLKKVQKNAAIVSFDYQQSFNRNLFFLHFADNEIIKAEFTYYPFPQLEKPKIINGLKIDSVLDIAVNKTFTIYQTPRSRDFIDLYCIIDKYKLSFQNLKKQARIKFDTHIDALQLAQQLLQINKLRDYPRLIIPLKQNVWQSFWQNEASKLKNEALKQ